MQNLIPLYRFERLYTLFYDKKDGEIYKIKRRKEPGLVNVFVAVSIFFLLRFIGEYSIGYNNQLFLIILLLISFTTIYFLTPLYIKWQYLFKTKETSYLYADYAKKGVKKGLKQYRVDLILTLISAPLTVYFAYLFLKNSQIVNLVLSSAFFASTLVFIFTKPHLRKKLLKEMNTKN